MESELLRIIDEYGRVVCEAPLLIHDAEATLRVWKETMKGAPVTIDLGRSLEAAVAYRNEKEGKYTAFLITAKRATNTTAGDVTIEDRMKEPV